MWQLVNGQAVDLPYQVGTPIPPPYGAPQQGVPYNFQGQQQTSSYGANNAPNNGAKVYSNIIRVYGIEGARNYPLPNNSNVVMHDNENDIEYHVTVDETGKRNVLQIDLSEHKEEPKPDYRQIQEAITKTQSEVAKLREEVANMQSGKKPLIAEE